jgi:hypothetical protein
VKAFSGTTLGLILLLGACDIEPTPADYIDRVSAVQEGRDAAAEVRDRILAMGRALGRGNPADALVALAPARDAYVVGPQAGLEVRGPEQISQVLQSLAAQPVPFQMRDVVVTVGSRGSVAWFRALMEPSNGQAGAPSVHITGVYVLSEGAWQLVQAHLSSPVTASPPSSPPAEGADSAGAE